MKWLRTLIADEVSKVNTALDAERTKLLFVREEINKALGEAVDCIKSDIDCHLAERCKAEFAQLEATIATLTEREADAFQARIQKLRNDAAKDEPASWQADKEDVKADHALRHPRTPRR